MSESYKKKAAMSELYKKEHTELLAVMKLYLKALNDENLRKNMVALLHQSRTSFKGPVDWKTKKNNVILALKLALDARYNIGNINTWVRNNNGNGEINEQNFNDIIAKVLNNTASSGLKHTIFNDLPDDIMPKVLTILGNPEHIPNDIDNYLKYADVQLGRFGSYILHNQLAILKNQLNLLKTEFEKIPTIELEKTFRKAFIEQKIGQVLQTLQSEKTNTNDFLHQVRYLGQQLIKISKAQYEDEFTKYKIHQYKKQYETLTETLLQNMTESIDNYIAAAARLSGKYKAPPLRQSPRANQRASPPHLMPVAAIGSRRSPRSGARPSS